MLSVKLISEFIHDVIIPDILNKNQQDPTDPVAKSQLFEEYGIKKLSLSTFCRWIQKVQKIHFAP